MRPSTAAVAVGLALLVGASAWAQAPPPCEVRTYIDSGFGLSNYYPGLPAVTAESTIKEAFVCPYCGYSTGVAGNCPNPWQANNHPNNLPLEPLYGPERFFQFQWTGGALGLVRGMPLRPGDPNRFLPDNPHGAAPNYDPRSGRPVDAVTSDFLTQPTNWQSFVRAGFACDASATSRTPAGSQVRFLLIPPGAPRPTARYYNLTWDTTKQARLPDGNYGNNDWLDQALLRIGVNPWRAVDGDYYQVRIRLVEHLDDIGYTVRDYATPPPDRRKFGGVANKDGDFNDFDAVNNVYERQYTSLRVQVWSRANGVEMDRTLSQAQLATFINPNPGAGDPYAEYTNPGYGQAPAPSNSGPNGKLDLVCNSGAVRLTIPLMEQASDQDNDFDSGGMTTARQLWTPLLKKSTPETSADDGNDFILWWVIGFSICNSARMEPDFQGPLGGTVDWLDQDATQRTDDDPGAPTVAGFSGTTNPQNYFVVPNTGQLLDTAEVGNPGSGITLSRATAREFQLRPGETGVGMVAALWRTDAADMWTYDWSAANEGTASDFDDPTGGYPGHPNGIQPIAARFFSTSVEVPRPTVAPPGSLVDLTTRTYTAPTGVPGGQTEPTYLDARDRQAQGSPPTPAGGRESLRIMQCPRFIPGLDGRPATGGPFLDPLAQPSAGSGTHTGRSPGGDPAGDHSNSQSAGTRVVGCGSTHRIWYVLSDPANPNSALVPVQCWCGRTHDPSDPVAMRCNYCGTVLRNVSRSDGLSDNPPASSLFHDVEPDELPVDVGPAMEAGGHLSGVGAQMAGEAARRPQDTMAALDGAPGQAHSGSAGPPFVPLPTATLYPLTVPLLVDLPQFQLASYPGVAGEPFRSDMTTPQPYCGGFVLYRAVDERTPWYEDLTGAHLPGRNLAADASRRLYDGNGRWDIYYRCPDCGNKLDALGACSYATCPGHRVCTKCGVTWEAPGEGTGAAEIKAMLIERCPFCPRDRASVAASWDDDLDPTWPTVPDNDTSPVSRNVWLFTPPAVTGTGPTTLAADNLTAEEFDPVVLQTNVLRKTRLGTEQLTVDVGRTAPGVAAGTVPSQVSPAATGAAETQTNYALGSGDLRSLGAAAAPAAGANLWTVTTAASETMTLVRDEVNAASSRSSPVRVALSVPLTAARLLAAVPSSTGTGWGANFDRPPYRGAAGAQAAMVLLQAGGAAGRPVPTGTGTGSYSGVVLTFVDALQNATGGTTGALDFLDRSNALAQTNSSVHVFDPTEDIALEPVVALNARLRIVEGPVPYNSALASDASPAPLFLDTNSDGLHDSMHVVWETNRRWNANPGDPETGTPDPDATANLAQGTAAVDTGSSPGIAWDYAWVGAGASAATQVTSDTAARTVNGSPEVYVDPASPGRKWLLWHKAAPTPTETGFASALWSSSAALTPLDSTTRFGQAANTRAVFDAALEQDFIRGFVRPSTANPPATTIHWAFWNAGKRSREEIRYIGDYDPTDPKTTTTTAFPEAVLPVSNAVPSSARSDLVTVTGPTGSAVSIRKPSKSPFTYARDPAPLLVADPADGDDQLHVFFSGFVPQDGNADICYARFDVADLRNADRNYGKVRQPCAGGWLANMRGEQFRADGMRQTFGSRHLDWLTTARRPRATSGADFIVSKSSSLDPRFWVYTVRTGDAPWGSGLELTWTGGRYDRADGVYRLSGLKLSGADMPVDPRSKRPLELEIDPAAGVLRFSAPLFDAAQPSNPIAVYNTGQAAYSNVVDIQVWGSYYPYIYRLTRNDANDDSPSAFFDYGGPGLAASSFTAAQRAALGRFVVFWRRSEGASEALHFGRTSFMYRVLSHAVQVGFPPIANAPAAAVRDITAAADLTPLATDLNNGIIGLSTGDTTNPEGHVVRLTYTQRGGAAHVEYVTVPGWGAEKRVNVDTVTSEGPLVVRREWHGTPLTSGGETSQLLMPRYWLFWTSPRTVYRPDAVPANCRFAQTRDVYYTAIVPEFGTTPPEVNRYP